MSSASNPQSAADLDEDEMAYRLYCEAADHAKRLVEILVAVEDVQGVTLANTLYGSMASSVASYLSMRVNQVRNAGRAASA